ncbi:MAG TPA: transposase [Niallia sp.]|nr:transposase [Niallia sp.]
MILDNARIHNSKLLKPFWKRTRFALLFFFSPYSPKLNAVKRIWGWLKESVIVNQFHATGKDIRRLVLLSSIYLGFYQEKILQRIGALAMSEN